MAGRSFRGKPGPNRGRTFSAEVRAKMSASHSGPRCYLWRGGVSFEPYTLDWTKTLKRSIRERDRYICQSCGALQGDTAFDVHHIDFDKANSDPANLVTLCHSCHSKTSITRAPWMKRMREA
jgi:5-methylcytosine-specific restriction endonuclease McrA